ncbi:MAG: TldD/PmbA family protein [Euryarchaeota archaeon]|nr:TldD/PmbA family protein [Euryarchaeota archaeon]
MEERLLEMAAKRGVDFADVRLEETRRLSLEMKDGKLKKAIPGSERGISVRVLVDGGWGFYSTNRFDNGEVEAGLDKAVRMARASAGARTEKAELAEIDAPHATAIWTPEKPPEKRTLEEKSDLLSDMYGAVKDLPELVSVTTAYGETTVRHRYLSTEGADLSTGLTRILAQTHFIAKNEHGITSGRARIGGTGGFEHFDREHPADKAVETARVTITQLSAKSAPGGKMTVIADPDLTGVFTHEAVGHASEADLVLAGDSCLEGMLGKQVANEIVTVVDDSTLPGGYGSFAFDDNGIPGQRKVLIESGIQKDFMSDRYTAKRLGLVPNGAARAESYAHRPLVRMSNTFIEGGDHSFEELFEGVKTGVYAKGTRGGQVDTAKGGFQFSAQEAYLIENGEITRPLRDVSVSGTILTTLKNIDALGNDWALGDPGICGKGQMVPVGDGGPTTRIRDAIVGGSS